MEARRTLQKSTKKDFDNILIYPSGPESDCQRSALVINEFLWVNLKRKFETTIVVPNFHAKLINEGRRRLIVYSITLTEFNINMNVL